MTLFFIFPPFQSTDGFGKRSETCTTDKHMQRGSEKLEGGRIESDTFKSISRWLIVVVVGVVMHFLCLARSSA